jgi:hypothetical protein
VNGRLPNVRLSKDRAWAVCFAISCGERFAKRSAGRLLFLGGMGYP